MKSTSRPEAEHRWPSGLLSMVPVLRCFKALASDRRGATAIIIGLLSMVLLGFTALGTEVGYWYFVHRNLQNAADSAALSAVAALENISGTPDATHKTQATAEAKYTSARYGFSPGAGGMLVTVNIPPTSGSYTTQANAVEVILSQPQQLFLTAALAFDGQPLFTTNPTQRVRAVATPAKNGNGCVVTLDKGTVGITQNGNGNMSLSSCDLYVNSDSLQALDQNGNATLTAANAYIVGAPTANGNAALTTSGGTYTGTAPINDPYVGIAPPYTSPGGSCTNDPSHTISGGHTPFLDSSSGFTVYGPNLVGGTMVFCNNNWPPNGSQIKLEPGLYVFDGGTLGCQSCTITGDNVTIYLTGSTGSTANYAYLNFSGNQTAALNINAPTDVWMQAHPDTKAIEGIAIFGDRNDPCTSSGCSITSRFSGNASATINGVIYLPAQNINWNGNGGGTPTCSQLISYTATFNGNGTFTTTFSNDPSATSNCNPYHNGITGAGIAGAGAIPARLVE